MWTNNRTDRHGGVYSRTSYQREQIVVLSFEDYGHANMIRNKVLENLCDM